MKIPNGTKLKCVKDLEKNGEKILEKNQMYEVKETYERNGFLTVYVQNNKGANNYHEYSYFEDITLKRDELLDMLLG